MKGVMQLVSNEEIDAIAIYLSKLEYKSGKSSAKQIDKKTTKAELNGEKLFIDKTCHSCHGKDASTPIMPNYPSIAGQDREYLAQQIKDIKSGARSNGQTAAMKRVMHLVSDEEINAIAIYLSKLEYKPSKSNH